ncbi:MAG: propanediol utilization protein [Cypionkella sp.]
MARVCGHFGELLQGRIGPSGPVALVTLPCPVLWAEAQVSPTLGFSLYQSSRVIAPARLHRLLRALGLPTTGKFRLKLTMPAGGGAGASTAALIALAQAAGAADPQAIIAAVLAEEGASDPLLFAAPETVLWASRRGVVLADLPTLPRFEVLGGFIGPGQRTIPGDHDFPDISDLLADWPGADLAGMARLSSHSARRTLTLRGPKDDPTEALAQRHSALGFTIAHTGAARGLIFAPGTVPEAAAADLRARGFSRITRFRCGG